MTRTHTHGVASWADLSTPDAETAAGFYRELLGWTVERVATPMGPYDIGTVGGLEVGGVMRQGSDEGGLPAAWTVFVRVADVDRSILEVERAGGRVIETPFDLPDGRIAVVADPTGAVLGLVSGPEPDGPWLSQTPGAVCWVELLGRDTAAAERFYLAVLGWEAETQDFGGTRYTTFTLDGDPVAGMLVTPAEVPAEAPASWGIYFSVADCQQAEDLTVALGGLVLRPTSDVGDGAFAVLADPTGAVFQVMEHAT